MKSAPSAPGDPFCRLCLKTGDLDVSEAFFEMLGMTQVARDDKQVCLRFDGKDGGVLEGVPTTLVFSKTEDGQRPTRSGVLDHLAICTVSVDEAAEMVRAAGGTIVKEPVPMFGTRIMGLEDPASGLPVYLVETAGFQAGTGA